MFLYPWGDMHSLNLGWFLQKFNELREDWATAEVGIDGALDAEIQRAEDALSDVFDARDAAAASASAANSSAINASQSSLASMDARDQSIAARNAAQQAATNAAASETAASNSATAASNSATAAATSATQASQSATNAAGSATAAGQEATNAAGCATAAAESATDAADSATAAAASAARAEEVEESIPEDYTELSNDVEELKDAVNETLEQITLENKQYIYIDDGVSSIPASGILVFDTQQKGTGTPSASNVREITPAETTITCIINGKNIYRYSPTLRSDNNRYVTLRSGYSASAVSAALIIKPGESVYIRIAVSASVGSSWGVYGSWTDSRSEQVFSAMGTSSTRSFRVTNTRDYTRGIGFWLFAASGGTFANKTVSVMMNPDSYHDYEPANNSSVSIPLPSELANLICGGEYNIITGELKVTRKFIASYNGETLPGYWISSNDVYEEGRNPTIGANVAYDLETPEIYNLDPEPLILYDGYTYIYSYYIHFDSFTYRKANNTSELIKEVENVIAPVLNELIADTALVVDDFRIVNHRLYRITAPIAAGAALTPGTDCAQTTIAAVLKTVL